jgi:Spy/CpxP family protein refolding chaperone
MKKIINTTLLILFFSSLTLAQKGKWHDDEAREKFEQLEKIKLIETLELDEETTLRFFARRTEHRKQQEEVQTKIQQKIDNLDAISKSGRAVTVEEIKSNIDEINTLQLQFEKNRVDFINSLSDVLTYEQIAKLIVFEKQFRNEVRKLIMKERRPPLDKE